MGRRQPATSPAEAAGSADRRRWALATSILPLVMLVCGGLTDTAAGGPLTERTPVEGGSGSLFRVRPEVAGVTYRNVCGDPGQWPILEQNGQGVGVIDYDGDGLLDLIFPNGSTEQRWRSGKNPGCRLYRNLGGWRFEDVTRRAGVDDRSWSCGVAVADYDGDGDYDLYLLNWGPNVMYRNNGDGTFTDVTVAAGVGDPRWSSSGAFADYNGDGRLDLYVTNYVQFDFDDYPKTEKDGGRCLYRGAEAGCGPWCYSGQRDTLYLNAGAGRFVDASESAGLDCTDGWRGFGVVAADLDDDGDVDVYVGCDVMPNLYLENIGRGKFVSVGPKKGGAYNETGGYESGMGVAAADYDRDGALDLWVTNFADETNTYYRNEGGTLTDTTRRLGLGRHRIEMGWGICARDFDQDGRVDVFVANGHIYPQANQVGDPTDRYDQQPRLYLQNAAGRLEEVPGGAAFGREISASLRGCAAADLDNDGDLDIVAIRHNGPPLYLENLGNRPTLTVELTDAAGGRSPMGARLRLADGSTYWHLPNQGYQSSHDPRIHLPVPTKAVTVPIEIRWPDGRRTHHDLPAPSKQPIRIQQRPAQRPSAAQEPGA